MKQQPMISEAEMLGEFQKGYPFPPLLVRLIETKAAQKEGLGDAVLRATGDGQEYEFEAKFRSRSSPKVFEETVLRIAQWPKRQKRRPLLVVPYLRESQLNELQQRKLSGIDLCGNGVISVPGKLLVYRTGQPNRFPDSAPSKYAYRGATSLVARAFLCRPEFSSLADIEQEITARGGKVVISTVSKALKRLEEDLIIEREPGRFRLRKPDKLLDRLVDFYTSPKVTKTTTLTVRQPGRKETARPSWARLLPKTPVNTPFILSGRSSVEAYAVMGRQDWPVFYTTHLDALIQAWSGLIEESSRFVDLELRQTDDLTVYFDARLRNDVPYSSPLQAFLECSGGDKRERETAQDVRQLILREFGTGVGA